MIIRSYSLTDTNSFARDFASRLEGKKKGATLIGLYGDLGSGKTTFVQALARQLGITDTPTSPTFVIEKIYDISHVSFDKLIHIDAYRIENSHELEVLGWKELLHDHRNLILVEWPEKIADILPADMEKITFTFVDEDTREIEF